MLRFLTVMVLIAGLSLPPIAVGQYQTHPQFGRNRYHCMHDAGIYPLNRLKTCSTWEEIMDDTQFGTRNKRGDWKPFGNVSVNPRYLIPPEPVKFLKWIFGWNGYLFPWQFLWALIAIGSRF